MTSGAYKYHLGIAGEFFVAAQLQRLGFAASVTYGNAKRADVIAISEHTGNAVILEVKTSSVGRWPIGSRVPAPSTQLWVFVHLPRDAVEAPEYYVIDQATLHSILAPKEQTYLAQYEKKHGAPYGNKPGVAAATRTELASYRDRWQTIMGRL